MDKRDRIIYAAMEVFREKGIEKAKVSEIVKKAGIAQGTFYLYFPSRLSVMPYIAQKLVDMTVQSLEEQVDYEALILRQVEQIVQVIFEQAKASRDIFPFIYTGLKETNHLREWEEIYFPFYHWMSLWIARHQEQGRVSPSVNPARTAKLMIALIETTAEQSYWYDSASFEEVAAQKAELIQFTLAGLGVSKE